MAAAVARCCCCVVGLCPFRLLLIVITSLRGPSLPAWPYSTGVSKMHHIENRSINKASGNEKGRGQERARLKQMTPPAVLTFQFLLRRERRHLVLWLLLLLSVLLFRLISLHCSTTTTAEATTIPTSNAPRAAEIGVSERKRRKEKKESWRLKQQGNPPQLTRSSQSIDPEVKSLHPLAPFILFRSPESSQFPRSQR